MGNSGSRHALRIADLRRQLLENGIAASNRTEALLNKDPKSQLRTWRRGWMLGSDCPPTSAPTGAGAHHDVW
jgi:hypothetical protein